jgi:5-methylcytosine-specific restriction endonuclease McrA
MAQVKIIYADGRVERYVSPGVFRRARQGDPQAIFYSAYIESEAWYERRAQHLARYPNCRGCNEPAEVVHHKSYETLGNESTRHLLSLCQRCHLRVHQVMHAKEQQLKRHGALKDEMNNRRLFAITNNVIGAIRKEHGL